MARTIIKLLLFLLPFVASAQRAEFHSLNTTPTTVVSADPEATNYINTIAAYVTVDTTKRTAIRTFIANAKTHGYWTGLAAVYFPVWNDANADAINMQSGGAGTYNLTFNGSVTHSTSGIQSDGSTGYANTGIVGSVLGQNSAHVSIYSQTLTNTNFQREIGAVNGSSVGIVISCKASSTSQKEYGIQNTLAISSTQITGNSFITVSRTGATALALYRVGASVVTASTSSTTPDGTYPIYVLCWNNAGTASNFSTKKLSYIDIGAGLSATDESNHYSDVQALHTSFSIAQ